MIILNDVIELVQIDTIQNEIGDCIDIKNYTEVFAKRKSIKQSEFYQAQATGLKPEIAFEINVFEYSNETHVRYNDKEYKILRTYQVDLDKLEIVLEGVVNNG